MSGFDVGTSSLGGGVGSMSVFPAMIGWNIKHIMYHGTGTEARGNEALG